MKEEEDDYEEEEEEVFQMDDSWLGGSPTPSPPEVEELGRVSISSPVSSMGGLRASSSDSGTNSGWAMKLWMELRESLFSSPT